MMRTASLLLTLLLLVLAPLGARAECRYDTGSSTSVTFVLPATISIAANTPDGTVLAASAQAGPANPPTITCGSYRRNGKWQESAETMTYGVVNTRGGYLADNLTYATGIPGISYRITHPSAYLTVYPLNSTSVSSTTFSVTSGLELIKTGSVASGNVLAAGKLGDWRWDDSSGNTLIPETFWLGNSVTFTTPSCTVVANPIDVTLPKVLNTAFSGVGATAGKTPFQIRLSCPPGTAVTKITMHTASPDSHTGVVAPAGAGYASGVGVQILDGNSNAVTFETQAVVTPAATASIPYYARYFQTAPAVTSGPVKATVTFDVFYQ
ncbi:MULTISPECIES: fimbrial protein [unclassified Rhodanobacter]|uniref:fimbrial protein n=1 Tax=unclassified Rhodanobacter TaxID=2621553 RepID=UPI001BDF696A|nr:MULTISPECIES: fimbrial protein [unclassified Rhodanobacter]MBT2144389.1 fimbrial protein [Rhodanobacter sp. LX-99]MBT2149944.1 fimbrial protein [Rhodanobacter sp. LX-100]